MSVPVSRRYLLEHGELSPLDLHLSAALAQLSGEESEAVLLAVSLLSREVRNGHVCLELSRLEQLQFAELPVGVALSWPPPEQWRAAIERSVLCAADGELSPLVCEADRLYLRRYHEHERRLADHILARARAAAPAIDRAALERGLRALFPVASGSRRRRRRSASRRSVSAAQLSLFDSGVPASAEPGADLQRVAAQMAVEHAFCVISGGPGTGKTSTVVKILALLVEQSLAVEGPIPRMHLLAPTGKAAARLSESIARAKANLEVSERVRAAIPEATSTVHRALGAGLGPWAGFRHDRYTKLVSDLVLVDEASMVDLVLMARLFDALPDGARVILLGDRDQLASVEAGAVLGDICGAGRSDTRGQPLGDCVVHLSHSYRYAAQSALGALARAINDADADGVLELLQDPARPEVSLGPAVPEHGLSAALRAQVLAGYRPYLEQPTPLESLAAFERFRVLCAHRRGPGGVEALNEAIRRALVDVALLEDGEGHRHGQPLLLTRNDHQAGLYNGDVGLCQVGGEPAWLRVHFPAGETTRAIAPARLPPHEPAFALSVHKSQGSEFDEVAVVLPREASKVLSRELLYTAVTRARRKVVVHGSETLVRATVATAVQRASGLGRRLWPGAPPASPR